MDVVSGVVDAGLCHGCGTCVGMCPSLALTMARSSRTGTLVPSLDPAKCVDCGLCTRVCPGLQVPFTELSHGTVTPDPGRPFVGRTMGAWSGVSGDAETRRAGSSGGMLSSVLIHALASGRFDGAMVTRMAGDDPFMAEPFIAWSPAEVLEAAGSKYVPVPLNVLLRTVLDSDGKFVAVGLPCHIHGIRLAQEVEPRLRERIPICVSLVCHHTPSALAMEVMLRSLGVEADRVSTVEFRTGGWPGGLRMTMDDGAVVEVPYSSKLYWGGLLQRFFVPDRCLLCVDKMSVLSDLTFMDAWRVTKAGSDAHTGIVVARTPSGNALLQSAVDSGSVSVARLEDARVLESQDFVPHFRRRSALIERARKRGMPVPSYGFVPVPAGRRERMDARVYAALNSLSFRRGTWPFISLYARVAEAGRRMRSSRQDGRRRP